MGLYKFGLFCTVLLHACVARPDILFIDLNDGYSEQAAAQKAAAARGEKLIVFPSFDPAKQAHIHSLDVEIKLLNNKTVPDDAARVANDAKIAPLQAELDNLRITNVNPKTIEDQLTSLEKNNTKVTSLVISGHDGNGSFTGHNGEFSAAELNGAFAKHAGLRDGVTSIFLAGCYTAPPGAMEAAWKGSFPNLQDLGGYDKTAPLAEASAGWVYMENFLIHAKALANAKDDSEIHRLAASVIPAAIADHGLLCLPNEKIATRSDVTTLQQVWKQCGPLSARVKSELDTYNGYLNGAPGFDNPPADPHKGDLRAFYDDLEAVETCQNAPGFDFGDLSLPEPDDVQRLMFYKDVLRNLRALHGAELTEDVGLLENAGISKEDAEKVGSIDKLSRRDAVALVNSISRKLGTDGQQFDMRDDKVAATMVAANRVAQFLQDIIVQSTGSCIPSSWVDGTSRKPSPCSPGRADQMMASATRDMPILRLNQQVTHLELLAQNPGGAAPNPNADSNSPGGVVAAGVDSFNAHLIALKVNALQNRIRSLEAVRDKNTPEQIAKFQGQQADLDAKAAAANGSVDLVTMKTDPVRYFSGALEGAKLNTQAVKNWTAELQKARDDGLAQNRTTNLQFYNSELDRQKIKLTQAESREQFIQYLLESAQKGKVDTAEINQAQASTEEKFFQERLQEYNAIHHDEVLSARAQAACAKTRCADADRLKHDHEEIIHTIIDGEIQP